MDVPATREEVYGAYLDELLAGRLPDPQQFLTKAGVEDAQLLRKLRALFVASKIVPKPATPEPADAGEEIPFQRLGDYRLIRRLGEGGMGTVFLAEQEALGRQVALKVIRADLFGSTTTSQRFQREARSLARLQHPGVVTVFDFGVEQGVHYLAMEQVPGRDLAEHLVQQDQEGTAIPPSEAVRWIAEVARALQCVHEAGILHRDVKASNIRITPEGKAVLVDFGLAIDQGGEGPTLTQSFLGSPAYASPEQIRGGRSLDPRADVYSLGVTLYRCITGVMPFAADDLKVLFRRILESDPPPPKHHSPGIPRDLDVVILHALEKDPERRYSSAAELADDLEALLRFQPIRARPPSRVRLLQQWARRHRASAAAMLTAAVAALIAVIFLATQASRNAAQIRTDAAGLIRSAAERVQEYLEMRQDMLAQERMVHTIEEAMETRYLSPLELRQLDGAQNEARQSALQRERLFHQILDQLDQAESIDAQVAGADAVRAELYLTRFLESEEVYDSASSTFYREQAERFDDGTTWNRLRPPARLALEVQPPGPVEIHTFLLAEQADIVAQGEHRLVPFHPTDEDALVAPGTWCLRVLHPGKGVLREDLIYRLAGWPIEGCVLVAEDRGRLQRGDRLLAVDGIPILGDFERDLLIAGESPDGDPDRVVPPLRIFEFARGEQHFELQAPNWTSLGARLLLPEEMALEGDCEAQLWRDGQVLTTSLAAGTRVRITTVPLLSDSRAWTRHVPGEMLAFEPGLRVLLLRRPGFEDLRLPLLLESDLETSYRVEMNPIGTTPDGFRLVDPGSYWHDYQPYWIMEHEVTSAQYLKFLNHAATQARIAQSAQPALHPRTFDTAASGGLWPRLGNGSYQLPADWQPDWPVFGVSWHDAVAYAEWRTTQAQAAGLRHRFRLPILGEFRIAARGLPKWLYPYGSRFRPNWSNCCFSRPRPRPEPILRYPVDESIYGVFDCSGSALEWLDAWWGQEQAQRFAGGGSWAQGGAIAAKPSSGLGMLPDATSMETSFRLVLEIERD